MDIWWMRLANVIFWILAILAAIWAIWIVGLDDPILSLSPIIILLLLKIAFLYIIGIIKEPKDILKLFM